MLIVAEENYCPEEINAMIKSANREAVDEEDQLSDHGYIYKCDTGEILYA